MLVIVGQLIKNYFFQLVMNCYNSRKHAVIG